MHQRFNAVKSVLAEGKTAFGVAVQMYSPETVEIAGAVGYDFVYIDSEHGSFYLEGVTQMLRAAEAVGITAFVRVPTDEPSFIMRVLDAGAMGVIVPRVSTAAQARAIVSAARYKDGDNGGTRGACPGTRATWHQTTQWPQFVTSSNENISVIVILETEEGLTNFEEISAVKGVDATMFGPFDFAMDIGYPGQPRHPEVQQRYNEVMKKAKAADRTVIASLFSHEPAAMQEETRAFIESGAKVLVAGGDRRILFNGLHSRLNAMRTSSDK
jgi:4-hydroxy-2-oxoheptanedioate aldolase